VVGIAEESVENLPDPDACGISWADEVEGELDDVKSDCDDPFIGQAERRKTLSASPTFAAEARPSAPRRVTAPRYWAGGDEEQEVEISKSHFLGLLQRRRVTSAIRCGQ
jgi:hypothetical protein